MQLATAGPGGKTGSRRLDARAKLIGGFFLIFALMTLPWGPGLWVASLIAVAAWTVAGVPVGRLIAPLAAFGWMLILTVVVHGFSTPGHIVWEMPATGWTLTSEGLLRGVLFAGRLIFVIFAGASIALTTDPLQAIRGVEKLALPLNRLGIPVGFLTLTFAMALRFVPTLYEEAVTLRKALRTRGWTTGRGLTGRVQAWIPLLIPLLVSGLRRSDDLATVLTVRGYDPAVRRTEMNPSKWALPETAAVSLAMTPFLFALGRML